MNTTESNCYVRAKFKWLEYSVDYNANGDYGTVTFDSASHIYTDNFALAPTVTPSPGYSLAGWATNATGEVVFVPGQSVTGSDIGATAGGGVTLYANWTQNVYSVTFCYTNSEGVAASTVLSVPGTENAAPPDSPTQAQLRWCRCSKSYQAQPCRDRHWPCSRFGTSAT